MRRQITLAILALGIPAFADINSTATLSTGAGFSFDSGTTTSSGDITFTGSSIAFQGGAKGGVLPGLTGASNYDLVTQTVLQSLIAFASPSPIPASSLAVGTIVGLQTKAGNTAKFLVTAISGSSLAFQFTTYGATGGGGTSTPTVKDVQNNSSLIPNGFPNSGVSPSTLFVIHGSNMADPAATAVLQDTVKGLPTTQGLNGATLSVSAGGKTFVPGIYYAIASQIAAVLPAGVPAGPATLTVSYKGQTSAPFSFTVVQSAYGISNYNGNTAVAQDSVSPTGALITPTNSAKPGQFITLWGTGLGADPADSDTTYISSPNKISTQVDAYIGGVKATNIAYAGASVYPGVHLVVLAIPQGVANGCFVPVAIVTGGQTLSNTPTISVMDNGGVCIDASTGITGSQISQLSGQTTVRTGSVIVGQSTSPGSGTTAIAAAGFQQFSGSAYGGGSLSVGACSVNETFTGGATGTTTALDAGTITMTGPSGGPVTLQSIPQAAGTYFAQLASGAIPSSGGAFTFKGSGGSGSTAVGSFTATINFPNPLISWTNQSASGTVSRGSGQTYTWTGGASGTYVTMTGSASANGVSGSYTCIAPVSAGQFTVPSYVLLGLPAGSGSSMLSNSTNYTTFSATGLDFGFAIGSVSFSVNSTFQ